MFCMKSFRIVLSSLCTAAVLGCASQPKPAPDLFQAGEWNDSSLVQTEYGQIEGSSDVENTWAWKGIPYAAPPVGQLRWKAPRPPQPWLGVRKAARFGSSSAQIMPVLGKIGSEDCLSLNVWRPKSAERMLPVYVYIHGGGNTIGSSNLKDYYGYAVASRSNMVYVSLNYRLGVFGWFRSPALAEGESALDASGNYGTLDIMAALRWVKENIRAFGGDPSMVTVAGESAGAFDVLSLLVSPRAEGLFQRAVVESGIAIMQSTETAESASRTITMKLLVRKGKARDMKAAEAMLDSMTNAEIRTFLYSVPSKDFLRVLDRSPIGLAMADWPTVYADGVVLPAEGYKAFTDGSYPNKVPLIIGTNKEETKLFLFFSNKPFKKDPVIYDSVTAYQTALWRWAGVDYVAQGITAQEGHPPVYAYRFDWGSRNPSGKSPMPGDLGRKLGAFHSLEIPFFLGTGTSSLSFIAGRFFTKANEPGRAALTDAAMRYLSAFARTGNPNDVEGAVSTGSQSGGPRASGAPLPLWEPYDPSEGGFKALVMDVDGAALAFSVLRDSPSLAAIRETAPAAAGPDADMGLLKEMEE